MKTNVVHLCVLLVLQITEPAIAGGGAYCNWRAALVDTGSTQLTIACDEITYDDLATAKAACCDCAPCYSVVSLITDGGQTVYETRYNGSPVPSDSGETMWRLVLCQEIYGYHTYEYQGVASGGDCITDIGSNFLEADCGRECDYTAGCVAFVWYDYFYCCLYDYIPCEDIEYSFGDCFYMEEAYPTEAPTVAVTPAPTESLQITDTPSASASGVISSCSLEDRKFTLQITENEQKNASDTSDEDIASDLSCEVFWIYLENEATDSEGFELGDDNSVGTCEIEGSSVVPLTVSLYKRADISQCVDQSRGKKELVSSMVDIDMPGYEEIADVFIFSIRYSLNPDTACINEIDDSASIGCEWFDVEKQEFTSSGCELTETKTDGLDVTAICECKHLTAFAILHNAIKHKDTCLSSNVFGNNLWIVYIILYTVVMAIDIVQIHYIFGVKESFKDLLQTKFLIHFQIVFICLLNISIAATFLQVNPAKPDASIGSLFAAWTSLYVLSFWVYSIVVYNWASIYHMDIGKSLSKYAKYVFLLACAIQAILIVFVFITSANSDEEEMKTNVKIGSTMIAVISLLLALAYVTYGVLIVRKLSEVNQAVKKDNNPVRSVVKRITVVTSVCFVMFLGQTIIVLISLAADEMFFSKFTAFQAVYLIFDISLLAAVMGIFYNVIRKQYYKKKLNTSTVSSNGARSV